MDRCYQCTLRKALAGLDGGRLGPIIPWILRRAWLVKGDEGSLTDRAPLLLQASGRSSCSSPGQLESATFAMIYDFSPVCTLGWTTKWSGNVLSG